MSPVLRVLQVEDSPSDAALIMRTLVQAGYQVAAERVETAAEMCEALDREHFHIVLADYRLPQFDGPGALAVLRESGQDLPFIVVSGTVEQDAAGLMMKQGAHDYVMKDDLGRLGPALERELCEAQERRDRRTAEESLRASEERFRALFLQAPIGVALADLDGRLTDANLAYCRMHGYEREELCGMNFAEIIHPDDRAEVLRCFWPLVAGESSGYCGERRHLRKDGSVIWVSATIASIKDANGAVLYCLGMFEDVTERRRAEQARRNLLATLRGVNDLAIELSAAPSVAQVEEIIVEKLRAITDAVAVAFSDFSAQTNETVVRRVAVTPRRADLLSEATPILGHEVIGLRTPLAADAAERLERTPVGRYSNLLELSAGVIPGEVAEALQASFGIGEVYGLALMEGQRLLGTCLIAMPRGAEPLSEELQSALGRVCSVAMSRSRAVEALQDSEERFSTIFHRSPLAILVARLADGSIVDANEAWCAASGWSREEAVGRSTVDLGVWPRPEARPEILGGLGDGAPGAREVELRCKSGNLAHVLLSATRTEIAGEPHVLSMAVDVSDRRRAEEALRVSEERFRCVFESVRDGILLAHAPSMRFLMANPAICSMLGYTREELLALRVSDIHPAEHLEAIREAFRRPMTSGVHRERLQMKRKDGTLFPADLDAVPVMLDGESCFLGVFRDMTAFDEMQAQMRQAQKMDAVGQLAGGIAHDFNNVLAVIIGYAELVQRRMTARGYQHGRIEQIRRAAERGANLTRQLLTFSRKQVVEPRLLDLHNLVRGMAPMLRRLLGEDVKLVTATEQNLGPVRADEGQLQQVVMNLAVNARDAMPHGGVLTIRTRRRQVTPGRGSPRDAAPGPYVILSVRDTGHGMDENTLAHLFEPFFTTKEPGKGTGLGLATVQSVVKQCGGYVEARSAPGGGASFRVWWPEAKGDLAQTPQVPPNALVKGGSETILILEDDAALRELEREILEGAGYRVLVAAEPEEAISAVGDSPGLIDLLLSDVIMPGMSGPELATRLVGRRPQLQVLYVSGYTADALAQHGVSETRVRLLQKPFTTDGLLRAVRAALDEARVATAAAGMAGSS